MPSRVKKEASVRLAAYPERMCEGCDVKFKPRRMCQKYHNIRCGKNAYSRAYYATEEGKLKHSKRVKDYSATEQGKLSLARRSVTYNSSECGAQKKKDWRRKWLGTLKGRAYLDGRVNRYREGDYGVYIVFKNEVFRDQVSCVRCGKPWIDGKRGIGHEVDHIVPRALGGNHDRGNLQVLCYDCHLAKTAIDHENILKARVRRAHMV